MLSFALGALIMALVAGILGFGGVASASTAVALIVFYVFLGLFVVSLLGMALGASREGREHTA